MLLSVPEAIEDLAAMKRLWVHEVLRVFGDRIVDQQDRNWLLGVLNETCDSKLGSDLDRMFRHLKSGDDPVKYIDIGLSLIKQVNLFLQLICHILLTGW